MNPVAKILSGLVLLSGAFILLSSTPERVPDSCPFPGSSPFTASSHKFHMPYHEAGLTDRQAAAHLLSRFTFGARPGEVDQVVSLGLEQWFRTQLDGKNPDDSLSQLLSAYPALKLTNAEIAGTYPRNGEVVRRAIRDGVVEKDSVKTDQKAYRAIIKNYMDQKGLRPEQELFRQFYSQKILRATCTNNQLREVMTDFWFNHFNVSITKNDCARFIPDFERDVIRPGALGKFDDLLLATAKSPAMLYYLDNFSSSGPAVEKPVRLQRLQERVPPPGPEEPSMETMTTAPPKPRKTQGLNENYAREVMELHTLGVDGGYTQQDVTQAARVLTGWTVFPMGENAEAAESRLMRLGPDGMERQGLVRDGDFFFNANKHDKGGKTVLGKYFPAGGGYDEGVQLLGMLAHHPSTARFICKKIAVRFVSDNPPQPLIDKMAQTFTKTGGNIQEVLITMVSAPEFWSNDALRQKTKSPFELAIGAVRSLDAQIDQPVQLYNWVTKMGEKIYYYQAPTGFPDKGQYWINTGSLLNRMNFGLALASGRIPGLSVDLTAINAHHEPESAEAALALYCRLIMPERDPAETIRRLTPLVNAPDLAKKVDSASGKANPGPEMNDNTQNAQTTAMDQQEYQPLKQQPAKKNRDLALQQTAGNNSMLAQVVGIIIGSPEYQRR